MIRVHHLADSRSQRILWLLEEIGRPYEVVRYERDPATMLAPPALKAIHPLGKSPVVESDGVLLVESGAIVERLVAGTALAPAASDAGHHAEWLHFAEGSAMTPLLLKLYVDRMGAAAPAMLRDRATSQIGAILDLCEAALSPGGWLVGPHVTGADIMMSFPLELAAARGGLDATRPNLWRYLATIHARPAWTRAIERGGPYAYGRP